MINYTEEQRDYIVQQYTADPQRTTVDRLAKELGKTIKSIIGKLSKEGVYRREVYRTKRGETPRRKEEMVQTICEYLNTESLEGLEKTPKLTLGKLEKLIEQVVL